MSLSFRQRLQRMIKEKQLEALKLTQADKEFVLENLRKICPTSDELARLWKQQTKSNKPIDQIIDEMSDSDFKDFVAEVLDIAFKKLGYKKGKKKKKKDPQKNTDSDSDSDSDSESEIQEEEQIACGSESN